MKKETKINHMTLPEIKFLNPYLRNISKYKGKHLMFMLLNINEKLE